MPQRLVLSAALVFGLACTAAEATGGTDVVLTQLSLTPATAALLPAATQQFAVAGVWSDGATDVPTVTYVATGGTVSATGLYTAGASAGTFRVIASHAPSGLADTAVITVSVPAATLSQLTLTPASTSVQAGGTAQFSVAALWSDGSTALPPIEFTATGGTINTGGLFTAGATPGAFRAIVSHAASGRADTSAITITAAPPSATILVDEPFEDNNAAARGWYDISSFVTTTAEKAPGTSTRSIAWSWAVGQEIPSANAVMRHALPPTTQVYISYWVKYSANWVGSGQTFHPHEMYLLTTASGAFTGPAFTRLTTYIEHNYQNGGIPIIGTTDGQNIDLTKIGQNLSTVTENRSTAGCNGNTDGHATDCYALGNGNYNNGKWFRPAGNAPAFQPNPGPGYKGDWHHVEVFFKMNTIVGGIGQTDGVAQYWFDGQQLINRTNVLFRTGAQASMQWNQLMLGPYIGAGSPAAQTAWIDNLLVATAKP